MFDKIVKKGFLIANIKFEFDSNGKIKNNYIIDGYIKDAKINILDRYNFQNLDLIFDYKKDNLTLGNLAFSLNDLKLFSEKITLKKDKNDYLIKGNINHKKIDFNKKNFNLFIKPFLKNISFEKLRFSSSNLFSFRLDKKFKFNDFALDSKVSIDEFSIINKLSLKSFFPNVRESLNFSDHELTIKYIKDDLSIDGKGKILIQDKNDLFTYSLYKKRYFKF